MKKATMDRVIIERIGQVLRVTKHLGMNQTAISPNLALIRARYHEWKAASRCSRLSSG